MIARVLTKQLHCTATALLDAEQIDLRERRSVRHVNTTILLAFLAPKLVRAAVILIVGVPFFVLHM